MSVLVVITHSRLSGYVIKGHYSDLNVVTSSNQESTDQLCKFVLIKFKIIFQ